MAQSSVSSGNSSFSEQLAQRKRKFVSCFYLYLFIYFERKRSTKEARGLLRFYVDARTAGIENDEVGKTQAKAA